MKTVTSKLVFVIFGGGVAILILGTFLLYSSLGNPAQGNTAFAILALGLGFSALAMAYRAEIFLTSIRRTEVNEKIAMLYGYAGTCAQFPQAQLDGYFFGRMFADIRAIKSVATSMTENERVDFQTGKQGLVRELRAKGFNLQADRVEAEFAEILRSG